MRRAALFLDRDGVLNVDHGYVYRFADFQPVEGVFEALRIAALRGYALIVITNQSGIGRGYFTQRDYNAFEAYIHHRFAAEGITLAATYHCPHHPDDDCDCRKPRPGMILRAARDYNIELSRSAMIGDKPSDAEAARLAGVGQIELITPDRGIVSAVNKIVGSI